MPSASRNQRITRRELRQPDEFQSFVESASDYIAANLFRFILVVIGLLALVLVVGIVRSYIDRQQSLLAESFYQATSALGDRNYKSAAAQFSTIARDHPSDSLGILAHFYAGNAYLAEGDSAKAHDEYRTYLDNRNHPSFRELALMQLGVVEENLHDSAGARRAYAEAAALRGPEEDRAEINVARLMAQQGDKKGAIAAYQNFLHQHPFTEDRAIVIDALADLGASPAVPKSGLVKVPGSEAK